MKLLQFTQKGIYCERADVYIDPWKPVDRALITHGHSDHARNGHRHYLCTQRSVPILKHRLGKNKNIQGIEFGKNLSINGVDISFHPAGHIIGSAQIKISHKGETWVVSGDYKLENDGITEAYELLSCQHFITESTFALPVYKWRSQDLVFDEIHEWWRRNKAQNKLSILIAYSLGKSQRIIHNLDTSLGKIYTHESIENLNEVIRASGVDLKPTVKLLPDTKPEKLQGNLLLAPSSAIASLAMSGVKEYSIGMASGWMAINKMRRGRTVDKGFVLSDHCDWPALNLAIKESGAEYIYPTHGYTAAFSRWLTEQGYNARPVKTSFRGEVFDSNKNEGK